MKKEILAALMAGLIVATVFTSCFSVSATSSERQDLVKVDVENNYDKYTSNPMEMIQKISRSNGDDIDRWAVIIGVGKYIGGKAWYTNADECAMELHEVLQEKDSRWTTDNIRLLINETASQHNITDALDWLKENADEGDIILFFFSGHGSYVKDESPYDELDRYDEVICPYDCYRDKEDILCNYITDDVLSAKFDAISDNNVEGMFLVFDSCLSGGLIDWFNWNRMTNNEALKAKDTINLLDNHIYETFSTEVIVEIKKYIDLWNRYVQEANRFTVGLTEDIDVKNRVVATATIPHAVELVAKDSYGTMIAKAVKNGKTSAERISRYAKWHWELNWLNIFLRLFYLIPFTKLNDLLWTYYNIGYAWLEHPATMWKDGYPADDPKSAKLPIIGDGDNNNQNNYQNGQNIPQSNSQNNQQPSSSSFNG